MSIDGRGWSRSSPGAERCLVRVIDCATTPISAHCLWLRPDEPRAGRRRASAAAPRRRAHRYPRALGAFVANPIPIELPAGAGRTPSARRANACASLASSGRGTRARSPAVHRLLFRGPPPGPPSPTSERPFAPVYDRTPDPLSGPSLALPREWSRPAETLAPPGLRASRRLPRSRSAEQARSSRDPSRNAPCALLPRCRSSVGGGFGASSSTR